MQYLWLHFFRQKSHVSGFGAVPKRIRSENGVRIAWPGRPTGLCTRINLPVYWPGDRLLLKRQRRSIRHWLQNGCPSGHRWLRDGAFLQHRFHAGRRRRDDGNVNSGPYFRYDDAARAIRSQMPPASAPSTTTAEAPRDWDILASLAEDTIGTIGVPESFPQANISREKPAPATTRSIPSSIAVVTKPLNSRAATMTFIPIIPRGDNFLANLISCRNSSKGMPDAAIRPIPLHWLLLPPNGLWTNGLPYHLE